MKQRALRAPPCLMILVLAAALAAAGSPASAESAAIVHLAPAEANVVPGESVEISVWIEDVADLYGAEIHLSFDPAVLRIVDADDGAAGVQIQPGPLLDPAQGFVAANQVDHERGEVVYALTLLSPATPASGSGELARFSVEGIAPGRSEWGWGDVILANRQGEALLVETEGGSILVGTAQATQQQTGTPPAVTPTSSIQTPAPLPTSSPGLTPTGPAPSPTSAPAGTGTSAPPSPAAPTIAVATQLPPAQTSAAEAATLAPGSKATPESPGPTTVIATLAETTEPVQTMPTGRVSDTSADGGASLSALPAVLAALTVALLLFGGRYLYRRLRKGS